MILPYGGPSWDVYLHSSSHTSFHVAHHPFKLVVTAHDMVGILLLPGHLYLKWTLQTTSSGTPWECFLSPSSLDPKWGWNALGIKCQQITAKLAEPSANQIWHFFPPWSSAHWEFPVGPRWWGRGVAGRRGLAGWGLSVTYSQLVYVTALWWRPAVRLSPLNSWLGRSNLRMDSLGHMVT